MTIIRKMRLMRDTRGVTALEYGLLAGMVAMAASYTAHVAGTVINTQFTIIAAAFN